MASEKYIETPQYSRFSLIVSQIDILYYVNLVAEKRLTASNKLTVSLSFK